MAKNHEIKFAVEKTFKDEVDQMQKRSNYSDYKRTAFYRMIFKKGLQIILKENFTET